MNILDIYRRRSITERILFLLLFFFLFGYLIVRAVMVPMLGDETLTFYNYIQSENFIPYFAIWDANNHILNSFLSFLSFKLFGNNPLSLRLPNVLSFIVFAYYVVLISENFKSNLVRITFVLTLLLTHNLIEFFNLSRGYGMSMALMSGSIYYALRFSQTKKVNYQIYLLCFLLLSLLSNLALLSTSMILIGYSFMILRSTFKEYSSRQKIKLIIAYLLFFTFLIFLITYIWGLKKRGLLYIGSLDGFYSATLEPVTNLLFYTKQNFVVWIIISLFFVGIIGYCYQNRSKNSLTNFLHFKLVYFYLLVGNIIALYSLALVLKVNYPPDRVALYLYPLFVGFLFFLLDDIEFKNVVKLKYLFCFLVVGAMVLNFCMNLNITHSSAWDYECLPYRFCETVERYNKQNKMQATINAYCSYEGVWAYRNNSALKNLNQISYTDFPSQKADFEIAMLENMAKDWQYDYDLIDFDPISKRYLLKRKHFLKRIPIYNTGKLISFKTREEFYAIKVLDSINPIASKTMLFSYKGKIKFEENAPSLLDIVINIEDEKSTIRYDRIPLLWHTGVEKGKWIAFEFNYYISDISPSARKYTTYFWNVKPKEYSIKEFSYTLSEMEE